MAIKYYLQPYTLASDKKAYKARAVPQIIYDEEGIINEMLLSGSTITGADCHAVLTVFFETVATRVAQGNHVNTRLFKIKPVIGGVFKSPTDNFDNDRHIIKASFSEGTMLAEVMAKAKFEKTTKKPPMPVLEMFTDVNSGRRDDFLTPGGIGVIDGICLDFNADNGNEGIYLVGNHGETVKVALIASVLRKKVVFQIPMLATGTYKMELRKDFGKTKSLLRTGRLQYALYTD
jgi:hypothetical protein